MGFVTLDNPVDDASDWSCGKCGRAMKGVDVDMLVAGLESEAEQLQKMV